MLGPRVGQDTRIADDSCQVNESAMTEVRAVQARWWRDGIVLSVRMSRIRKW